MENRTPVQIALLADAVRQKMLMVAQVCMAVATAVGLDITVQLDITTIIAASAAHITRSQEVTQVVAGIAPVGSMSLQHRTHVPTAQLGSTTITATMPTHPGQTTGVAALVVRMPDGPMLARVLVGIVDSALTCLITTSITTVAVLARGDITTPIITTRGGVDTTTGTTDMQVVEDATGVPMASPMAELQRMPTTTVPHVTVATTPGGLEIFAIWFTKATTLIMDAFMVVLQASIAGTTITQERIARVVQEAGSMEVATALTATGIAKAAQVDE